MKLEHKENVITHVMGQLLWLNSTWLEIKTNAEVAKTTHGQGIVIHPPSSKHYFWRYYDWSSEQYKVAA